MWEVGSQLALNANCGRMTGNPSIIPVREGFPTIHLESMVNASQGDFYLRLVGCSAIMVNMKVRSWGGGVLRLESVP